MNCQEVLEILDNQKVDRLDAAQRRQAEAHVAVCADCARAWNAQSSLALLPDLALSQAFVGQCRAAVAAMPASRTNGGGRGRILRWGSLAALAAAAAALGLISRPTDQSASGVAAQVLQTGAAPLFVDVSTAQPPTAPADVLSETEPVAITAPRFTVRVVQDSLYPDWKELAAVANDPVVQEILRSVHTALVAELRKIPDLALVDKDPAQITPARRHYRLQIGPDGVRGYDGKMMRWVHGYPVGLIVRELQPDGASVERLSDGVVVGVDFAGTCVGVPPARDIACLDAPQAAAELVSKLRKQVFPPDISVTQPLQARFEDSSLAPEERFNVLVELFKQQAKTGGRSLVSDKGVVRAVVELSRLTDASHRAQLWRAMRGVGDAQLVEPMLASLQQDPEEVRIAALETLAADFSDDQRARSALETVALSDPRALVRAVAQRGITGEEGWNNYVVSSLKDARLPDSRRVEALMYALYPPDAIDGVPDPSPSNYWQILKGLDAAAVQSLAEIFPRAEVFRHGPSNNLLGNFSAVHGRNPVVTDLLLTVLAQDPKALNRAVAAQGLAEAHASEPRVRAALLKTVSSDPDAMVRDTLSQILQKDYVKKAMEEAGR
jgi:hypothetical protein